MDPGPGVFSQLLYVLKPTPCLAVPSEKCVSGCALVTRLPLQGESLLSGEGLQPQGQDGGGGWKGKADQSLRA